MDPDETTPQSDANGHKDIRTLPPMKLGTGPEWRMPAELAVRFIVTAYQRNPKFAGECMHRAIAGDQP